MTGSRGAPISIILSAAAEAERDRIRERVSTVKADQKKRGKFLGGTRPFGFQVGQDGQLVHDEAEQVHLAEMRLLRDHGLSLRAIATAMKAKGVNISHEGVAGALRGPAALGT